jgi:hypothetical protein
MPSPSVHLLFRIASFQTCCLLYCQGCDLACSVLPRHCGRVAPPTRLGQTADLISQVTAVTPARGIASSAPALTPLPLPLSPFAEPRLLARNMLLNLVGMGAPILLALLCIPPLIQGLGLPLFGLLT